MIRLQQLTGARGGEICIMRPCDIDRSGKIWLYKPVDHKTAHYGYDRTIYIGPRAQQELMPFLLRPLESYCFCPAEADAERRAAMHARRKTRMSCGNRPGSNRKDQTTKNPGEHYTSHSYGRAIKYALMKAFPLPEHLGKAKGESAKDWQKRLTPQQKAEIRAFRKQYHWHPHQLRHSAATELRKEFGIEAARIILGHRSVVVTEVYAEVDRQKAIDAMTQVG
jgi:integrase